MDSGRPVPPPGARGGTGVGDELVAVEEGARPAPGPTVDRAGASSIPGWTPLFARASAVVVEVGGLFSHAATVAREYGLPAVSNVEGATHRLRDGDVVRVDGARGVVVVVSRAAARDP